MGVKRAVEEIPTTMRAVVLSAYDGKVTVEDRPVPTPQAGQVLVKIAAAPINPSDLMFLVGMYGVKKRLPVVPGFEAAGTVVAVGPGLGTRALLGRRVACPAGAGDGTWAQYMTAPSSSVWPLLPQITLEDGAMLLVNPLSAWAMVDSAHRKNHTVLVQTAAASQLGRLVVKLAQRKGMRTINVVRRPQQVDLLMALGAGCVLCSSDPDFDQQLMQACHEAKARLALDAVAGEMTGQLLRALPTNGSVIVYGALSQQPCQLNPADLIFGNKRLEGFWLSRLLRPGNLPRMVKAALQLQRWVPQGLASEVQERCSLEDAPAALQRYQADMTSGKVLLMPWVGAGGEVEHP